MDDKYRLKLYRGKWAIVWRDGGRTRRISTGTDDEGEARLDLARFLDQIGKAAPSDIKSLWADYAKRVDGRPVKRRMDFEWKALGPHFGHLMAENVTEEVCDAYTARRRAEGRSDGTIWTELGDLKTVLNWAEGAARIEKAPHIKRPSKPEPRDRYLTEAEITRLVEACETPHIRLAVVLMLGTAARVGAILDLTWDRVNFDENYIRLSLGDGKARKGRATVPMNGMVRAALAEAKKAAMTDHVIEWSEKPVTSIKVGFAASVRRAGLVGVSPHVLRHTAAVHMAKNGVPMSMIAQYLGHGDDRITQRVYARFAPDHMAAASEAVNFIKVIK